MKAAGGSARQAVGLTLVVAAALLIGCSGLVVGAGDSDAGAAVDAAPAPEGGPGRDGPSATDARPGDATPGDALLADVGAVDLGAVDLGAVDQGPTDAPRDLGLPDSGPADAPSPVDAVHDMAVAEASLPDGSPPDAWPPATDVSLLDINPGSPTYGQTRTLSDEQGKVIILYFVSFG